MTFIIFPSDSELNDSFGDLNDFEGVTVVRVFGEELCMGDKIGGEVSDGLRSRLEVGDEREEGRLTGSRVDSISCKAWERIKMLL